MQLAPPLAIVAATKVSDMTPPPPPPPIPFSAAIIAVIFTLLLLFPAVTSQSTTTTPLTLKRQNLQWGSFNYTQQGNTFNVIFNASINNGALQITPDSAGDLNYPNNSGRVFYNQPFTLWNTQTQRLATFNTSFLINVFRVNNTIPGEGIAFIIAPNLTLPLNSYGGFLGLTNSSTDGNPDNKLIAVELDTVKQSYDPDDNHLGLDINGVKSNVTVKLPKPDFEIAPTGAKFYALWIDYDGTHKVMDVYIASQKDKLGPFAAKPLSPVLSSKLDLKEIVNQKSYFGFSASTGVTYELNCVLRWNISIEIFPEKASDKKALKIGLGIGVPLFVLALLGFGGFGYCMIKKRRESNSNPQIMGALKSLPGTPREFLYRELKKATNNFDEKNKLGQGGFGVVYKGTLPKEKLEVAVKRFSRDKMKSTDDFLAELTIINRLRHKHLVKLQGWCHKNGVLLLVYEYMPNGSLDDHIFIEDGISKTPLSWNLRYKIISGVSSALNYLHNEYDQKVIHRDLKASNIMLDSDFNARLGDFGLARAIENEKTSYAELEGVPGTIGYIAPECFHTGKATRESDVYGFGAVLLEVVCGQRPYTKIEGYQFLVDWVWHLHRDGRILDAVDPRLVNDYVTEEAERVLKLGLACSHPIASERPKMQVIVQIISGSVPVPHVPPFKPSFVWPAVDLGSLSDLTSATTTEYTPINTHSSMNVEFSSDN